jgi:hypothetical protein
MGRNPVSAFGSFESIYSALLRFSQDFYPRKELDGERKPIMGSGFLVPQLLSILEFLNHHQTVMTLV